LHRATSIRPFLRNLAIRSLRIPQEVRCELRYQNTAVRLNEDHIGNFLVRSKELLRILFGVDLNAV
jgi:hypothetical protein